MRWIRIGAYLILIALFALIGNLIWIIGGNPIAVLLLGVTLLAIPARGRFTTLTRRLTVLGIIGLSVTVVSAAFTLTTVLLGEGPASVAVVAAGPALWVGSACSFGSFMAALGVESWANRARTQR